MKDIINKMYSLIKLSNIGTMVYDIHFHVPYNNLLFELITISYLWVFIFLSFVEKFMFTNLLILIIYI